MELRRLQIDDAPAAAALAGQLGYPTDAAQMEQRLALVAGSETDGLVGVFDGGGMLGWIHVQERRTLERDPYAEICALVGDEAARGSGIGAALVEEAERWAAARGLGTIHVRSNVLRERAHRFYERRGYVREKTAHAFTKAVRPTRAGPGRGARR